jgi:hypothetical protein
LAFVILQAIDFLYYVIKVDLFEFLPQLFYFLLGEALVEFILVDINDLTDSGTTDSAPSLDPQEKLLVAEDGPSLDLLQSVLDSSHSLENLPGLIANRKLMIVLHLDNGFHDEPSVLKDVKYLRLLSNIEDDVVWLVLDLVEFLIQLNQMNKAPILKER